MIRNSLVGRFYTAVFVVVICRRDGEPRLSREFRDSQGNGRDKQGNGIPLGHAFVGIFRLRF